VSARYLPVFSTLDQAEQAVANGRFDPNRLQPYNILTGLFCYGGKFRGTYVRSGQHALIVGFHGGITLGSLLYDYQPDDDLAVIARQIG
jgi:hypothetical protein